MTKDGSDLDWLAFQYIAGEMNSEDAARFESRLGVDQVAREAVAAAVALSEIAAITECRPCELVSSRSATQPHWTRTIAWLGWAAAACLLAVAFVQQSGWSPWASQSTVTKRNSLTRSGEPALTVGSAGVRSRAAPDLALAWVQTRASVPTEDLEDSRLEESRFGILEAYEAEDRRPEEAGISAPSWMVTAVAGLDVDTSEVE